MTFDLFDKIEQNSLAKYFGSSIDHFVVFMILLNKKNKFTSTTAWLAFLVRFSSSKSVVFPDSSKMIFAGL